MVKALPKGVRPVVLADRGFRRASFPHWLERHGLRYVVRLKEGTCIIQEAGQGWNLGREGLSFGELRFRESVRYGLYHGPMMFGSAWSSAGECQRARQGTLGAGRPKNLGIVVLAERLGGAVSQGFKEPLRPQNCEGELRKTFEPTAYGAHDLALLADFDGAARDRASPRGFRSTMSA